MSAVVLLMALGSSCSQSTRKSETDSSGQRRLNSPRAGGTVHATAAGDPAPTAAERYVIIHADDAGMCRSVNRATIDALEHGAVSSVSVMVPCPAFEEFAEYAKQHPQHDYGVHLTLNAEFQNYRWGPVLPVDEVPTLVDSSGYLWRTEHQVAAQARADEVERELRAQIDKAVEAGISLSHLDTHMGTLFMRGDFVDIYMRLGDDYDLPVLLTRDPGLLRGLGIEGPHLSRLDELADRLEGFGFPVVDHVLMHYAWDSVASKKRTYLNMLGSVQAGVTEIIVHCGYADAELRSITRSDSIRDGDRQVVMDPAIKAEIESQNLRLTSWKQLHKRTAAQAASDAATVAP